MTKETKRIPLLFAKDHAAVEKFEQELNALIARVKVQAKEFEARGEKMKAEEKATIRKIDAERKALWLHLTQKLVDEKIVGPEHLEEDNGHHLMIKHGVLFRMEEEPGKHEDEHAEAKAVIEEALKGIAGQLGRQGIKVGGFSLESE